MTIIIYVIEQIVKYNNYRLYLFLWLSISFYTILKIFYIWFCTVLIYLVTD